MRENAERLEKIAYLFKDKFLEIEADVHFISLMGDEKTLERAEAQELIGSEELDDDELFDLEDISVNLEEKNLKKAKAFKRVSYRCKKQLYFEEFFTANVNEFSEEKIFSLWMNKNLNLFCCECLEQLKCNNCGSFLVLHIQDEDQYFYCPNCVKSLKQSYHEGDLVEDFIRLLISSEKLKIIRSVL